MVTKVFIAALISVFLLGCEKSPVSVSVQESGLLGVWTLVKLNGKPISHELLAEEAEKSEEGPYDISVNQVRFELEDGQLVFSSPTGLAMIQEIQKAGRTLVLKAFYDEGQSGKVLRSTIVVHFVDVNIVFFTREGYSDIGQFYWAGENTLYSHASE